MTVKNWDWAQLASECLGVSSGGVGQQRPAWGPEHWLQECWPKSFRRRWPLPDSLASGHTTGREHSTYWQKIGLKFTEHGPTHQSRTQIFPQPVPLISKLPQAFYPSPSEGRQNGNHNHRKWTKLITWITALSDSMKLWAMPCRAPQDRQVMVESSDRTWSTGEGNGKPLQYSGHENPMNSMKRQKDRTVKDEFPIW